MKFTKLFCVGRSIESNEEKKVKLHAVLNIIKMAGLLTRLIFFYFGFVNMHNSFNFVLDFI